jgi:hypothetical protein
MPKQFFRVTPSNLLIKELARRTVIGETTRVNSDILLKLDNKSTDTPTIRSLLRPAFRPDSPYSIFNSAHRLLDLFHSARDKRGIGNALGTFKVKSLLIVACAGLFGTVVFLTVDAFSGQHGALDDLLKILEWDGHS